MRKDKRQKEVKLRKNFFITLLVITVLWMFIVAVVFLVDPETFGALPLLFLLIFLALFFTFSAVFVHVRRGFLFASGVTIFLILRYLGIGNILNLILLTGLTITVEYYFYKNE